MLQKNNLFWASYGNDVLALEFDKLGIRRSLCRDIYQLTNIFNNVLPFTSTQTVSTWDSSIFV